MERSNRASIGLRIASSMRSNRWAKVTFNETFPSLLRTTKEYTTPPSASVRFEVATWAFANAVEPSEVVREISPGSIRPFPFRACHACRFATWSSYELSTPLLWVYQREKVPGWWDKADASSPAPLPRWLG